MKGTYPFIPSNIEAFGVRWLVLSLGIWNQPDPIGADGSGNNLYQLEGGNAVDLLDSSGLCDESSSSPTAPTNFGRIDGLVYRSSLETASTDGLLLHPGMGGGLQQLVGFGAISLSPWQLIVGDTTQEIPIVGELVDGTLAVGQLAQLIAAAEAAKANAAAATPSRPTLPPAVAASTPAKPKTAAPSAAPTTPATPAAASAPAAPITPGQQIAGGHAGVKHAGDFAGQNMPAVIDAIINAPSDSKPLSRGRKAYWDSGSGTVVITDPNSPDGGTAFKPRAGKPYYDNLQ